MKANSNSFQYKSIIIGGGVGPAAGLDLHRHIIACTPTDGSDQDHLRVIHLSFSDLIPDRTEAIQNQTEFVPAERMAELINQGYYLARRFGREAVVGIPCNTFHAPAIFHRFMENLDPSIQMIHMIDESVSVILSSVPPGATVGILSTTGTRNTELYDQPLREAGLKPLHPAYQESVHEAIYHPKWGIKAVSGKTKENLALLTSAVDELAGQGAQVVILGCTELPLVLTQNSFHGVRLINPMKILASRLVEAAMNPPLP